MSKREFDSKLRALRLDLEHLEKELDRTQRYKLASKTIDEMSDNLMCLGDSMANNVTALN